jgi:hypothetical protein
MKLFFAILIALCIAGFLLIGCGTQKSGCSATKNMSGYGSR